MRYNRKSKKILILGGSGVVGRLLVNDLSRQLPELQIDIACRRPGAAFTLPNTVNKIELDIFDRERAIDLFGAYDLVVLVLGPFDIFKSYPHSLCIEAGVDCVDINDAFEATKEILKLDNLAREKNTMVLTSIGLTPGLSTLLLLSVLKKAPKGEKKVRVRLLMGDEPESGYAALFTLLANFKPQIKEIVNGKIYTQKVKWAGPENVYRFPQSEQFLKMVPYSSPEILTIQRSPWVNMAEISKMNHMYHIKSMPFFFPAFFSRFKLLRSASFLSFFSKKMIALQSRMKPKNSSEKQSLSLVLAECQTGVECTRAYTTGTSSYELTTAFIAAVTEMILDNTLQRKAGVITMEDCFETKEPFEAYLEKRDLFIQYDSYSATSQNPKDYPHQSKSLATSNIIMNQEKDILKSSNLKHFGDCWHSLVIPLSVKREQFKTLMTSRLANKFSSIRKIILLIRVLKRMSQNSAEGAQYAKFSGIESKRLVNDFNMMAAGFATIQDWMGDTEGYPVFAEMVIASGLKEMEWLWPDSNDFILFNEPFDAFKQYWTAYLDACMRLSIIDYEISIDKPDSFQVNITACAYHELFSLFEYPELTKLICETECRCLKSLTRPLGFNLSQKDNIALGGLRCDFVWQRFK